MAYIYDLVDTWNDGATTFTAVKMNVTDTASNAASNLMDLQVSTASKFSVSKAGNITSAGYFNTSASQAWISTANSANARLNTSGLKLAANTLFGWTDTVNESNAALDIILRRKGAANLALGAADAASGVQAQTLSVQSITGTNASAAAYPFKITGAQGTGNAAGGSIIFQVAPAGGAGPSQNTLVDALTINSERNLVIRNGGYIRTEGAQPNSGIRIGGNGFNEPILATEWVNTGATAFSTGRSGAGNSWLAINSTTVFGWGNGLDLGTGTPVLDVSLYRDAANTLALRNGVNAQAFRVYNTWTSFGSGTEIWERGNIFWDSNVLKIGTEKGANGGTARALEFQTDGTTRLTISATANMVTLPAYSTINTGQGGVVRMRYINDPTNVISFFDFYDVSGYAVFASSAANGRMNFCGTTSSFPALKRSTTILQTRLADDSAFATIQGKLRADVNAVVETPTATHTITITDAAGTAYKVLCVAA